MHTVFIGIGSNLGDRQKNCEMAVERLRSSKIAKNVMISKWYETEAMVCHSELRRSEESQEYNIIQGILRPFGAQNDNPPYINGATKLETELTPRQLLTVLNKIEANLGRVRTSEKWGPRTIDLDILFYDDLIINEQDLKIPHPEAHKRIFVLSPLCDIAPDLIHPVLNRTATQLKEIL